jgi:hypothetical protein
VKVNHWSISVNRELIIKPGKLCPYLYGLLVLTFIVTISCGKKANENHKKDPTYTNPQVADVEIELAKQELFCGGAGRTCPSYLTKIAVLHKDKLRFCTGFLTEDNVVVTSSSCLPERLRVKDIGCSKDVFFFFAEQFNKPTRVGCDKIIKVSQLNSKEPFLWRSDVAYIQLEKSVNKRTVSTSRNGMNDLDRFYIWSIDQIDDYQGIIRKSEDCQSIHSSYFNPLSNNQSSPVMTMAGCEFNRGNAGAPIFDYRGKVRAILSKGVDQAEIDEVISMRILERPLKPLVHVSNFACAPTIPEQDVLNENECNKGLDINSYDLGQSEMISESILFRNSIQKIEHEVNENNRYIKMAVELTAVDDAYNVTIYPKCFKNVSKWIGEFHNNKPFTFNIALPELKIKKAMNEYGRIFALEIAGSNTPTNVQFKPSILRNSGQATVFMWADGPTRTYQSVTEVCPSLF